MAQTDSGYGWSAKDGWLMSGTGLMGNFGKEYFDITGGEDQPIPVTGSSAADVISNGKKVYESGVFTYYASSSISGGYIASSQGAPKFTVAVHKDSTAVIYYAWLNGTTLESSVRSVTQSDYGTYNGVRWYYYNIANNSTGTWHIPEVPSSYAAGWRNACYNIIMRIRTEQTPAYKINQGAAVACFAKFRNIDGNVIITPLLISTNEDAVDISLDGTTETAQQYKSIHVYQGMAFYMTYIPGSTATSYAGIVESAELLNFAALVPKGLFTAISSSDWANIIVGETTNPYGPIDPSGEDGGGGDFDDTDDTIEDPPLPTLNFAASGFCRIYRADLTSLRDLSRYMWTDTTFIQTLVNHGLQMFEDPMKAVITLNMLPVSLSGHYGVAEPVSVMYIPTTAAMWPMNTQFVTVDCGSVDLHEHFGSVLDYNPYTRVSLFLPYIGSIDLDTDEVMGKTLSITYKIDVVSGICVAIVKADSDVRYQFSGHCAIPMPISSADFTGYLQAALSIGGRVVGAAMSAGAPTQGGGLLSPPLEGGGGGSTTHRVISTRNPETNRFRQAAKIDTQTDYKARPVSYGELIKRTSPNVIGSVLNSKLGVEHSSGFSGNSGYLGVRRPYLTIKRPNPCIPATYGTLNGYPSMISLNLGTCTGYTEVQSIRLTGFRATNPELAEIQTLLMSGVIL